MEINWSRWSQCQSSFELLFVPSQPGIFALAEEVMQPADASSRRMLAVFAVEEADDLSRAMSRLFAAGSQWREKMAESRCYVRYAVIANASERAASAMALQNWLSSRRETAAQIFGIGGGTGQGPGVPGISQTEPGTQPVAMSEIRREENDLKTIAERAVDRVTQGIRLSKTIPAGF